MAYLPEEWIDYVFLEPTLEDDPIPVKILTGPFKDVTLCFGTVTLHEDENQEIARLSFTFKIISPENKKELDNSPVFKEYIGRLLNSVILEATNESREDNTEVFDEEPRLRTEGPSVPKD